MAPVVSSAAAAPPAPSSVSAALAEQREAQPAEGFSSCRWRDCGYGGGDGGGGCAGHAYYPR